MIHYRASIFRNWMDNKSISHWGNRASVDRDGVGFGVWPCRVFFHFTRRCVANLARVYALPPLFKISWGMGPNDTALPLQHMTVQARSPVALFDDVRSLSPSSHVLCPWQLLPSSATILAELGIALAIIPNRKSFFPAKSVIRCKVYIQRSAKRRAVC